MAKTKDDYLTIDQVAKQLGVKWVTVRRWIDSGELVSFKVGPRLMRVRREDLDKFIEAGRTEASG